MLEHNRSRDNDRNELDLPDEVLALKLPEASDDEDEAFDEEDEVVEPQQRKRKEKVVDTRPKGRFAKPARTEEDEDEETGSSDDDEEEDDMVIPDVDLPSDDEASAEGSSADEDEAWRSYHVSTKARRRGKADDQEADEAEDEALELAEVERLQKKARARLIEADFLPFGGAIPLDPTTTSGGHPTTANGETFLVDRSKAPAQTLAFDTEPEAIAYLLRNRPECLALVDDFKRQLKVLRRVEGEVRGVQEIMAVPEEQALSETKEAIGWMHYRGSTNLLTHLGSS